MREGWEYKKFENCIVKSPKLKQVKKEAYNNGSQYPIISQEEKFISGYCDDESMVCHIDRPIVVFGDHTRVLKYIDFDFVVGADGVKVIIPIKSVDSKFLLYFLQWYNIPNLGYSRHYKLLKDVMVPIPNCTTQLSIVSELDKLNELIQIKKEQLKDYDALAQSIFYEMFGDPVENEKGWEVKKLGELCSKIGSGATPRGGNESYKDEGISLIRSLNVYNNEFRRKDLAYIDDEQAAALSNVTILEDDVLLNITGASIARCCIVPSDLLPARVNQHVCIIRPFDNVLVPIFLNKVLTNISYQIRLLTLARSKGATREALPKSVVDSLLVPLPPLSLQQSFAHKIEQIERQKAEVQKTITDLETLLAARMQYWFD